MDILPLGSYGKNTAKTPASMIKAPEMYTGTAVSRFVYNATTGACWLCQSYVSQEHKMETHQHAKHTGCSGCQAVPCAAMFGGKYLWSDRIEHPIHHLHNSEPSSSEPASRTHDTAKRIATVPPQKLVGRPGSGTRVQERSSEPFISRDVVEQ